MISDPHNTNLIAAATTTTGVGAISRRLFDPYGNPVGSASAWPAGDNNTFLNQPQNTAGLVDDGARIYNPASGRFLSTDPVLDTRSPQQVNGYSYANNNPVTNSDPSGAMCVAGAALGDQPANCPSNNPAQTHDPSGAGNDSSGGTGGNGSNDGTGGNGSTGSSGCLPALLPASSCAPGTSQPNNLPPPPPPSGLLPPANVEYFDLTPQPPCTGTVLDSVVGCSSVPVTAIVSIGRGTSFLGQMLRAGDTEAIRSSAAKGLNLLRRNGVLRDIGRLGRNPIMIRVSNGLTIVAGVVQTIDDLDNGSSVSASIVDGVTTSGFAAGGVAFGTDAGLGACIPLGPGDLICGGVGALVGGFVSGSFGHAIGRWLGKMF